jgi:hypothetical protein
MATDNPGVRVEKIATKKVLDGLPTVEKNTVGWANRTLQLGAYVNPADEKAVREIQIGESFVIMVGGEHEVPISATKGHAPAGTKEGDLLYINPADNAIVKNEAKVGYLPLGVVDRIEAAREVALVNTNDRSPFMVASE